MKSLRIQIPYLAAGIGLLSSALIAYGAAAGFPVTGRGVAPVSAGETDSADSAVVLFARGAVLAGPAEKQEAVVVQLVPPRPGYYRIDAHVHYNSGDRQQNESFFLRLTSSAGQEIVPLDANAGTVRVIPDDPGPEHFAWRNAGLYFLEADTTTVSMHHYAQIASDFPQFLTGQMGRAESVYLDSLKFIYQNIVDGAVSLRSTTSRKTFRHGDSAGIVYPGEVYDLIVQVNNLRDIPLRKGKLSLLLPDLVMLLNAELAPAAGEDRIVEWALPELAGGDSLAIALALQVAGQMPAGETPLLHFSKLSVPGDRDTTNNTASHIIYARADSAGLRPTFANMTVRVNVDRPELGQGDSTAFHLTLENPGPDTARGVRLNNVPPPFLTISEFSLAPDSLVAGAFFWRLADIPPGTEMTISFHAKAPACLPDPHPHVLVNVAAVSAQNDTAAADNADSAAVTLLPPSYDLSIAQRIEADTTIGIGGATFPAIFPGDTITIHLTLQHRGTDSACNVSLYYLPPPHLTEVIEIPPLWSSSGDTLWWNVESLSPADSFTLTLRFRLPPELPRSPLMLVSTAEVRAEFDQHPGNNRSQKIFYGLARPEAMVQATDVSLGFSSRTDSTVVLGGREFNTVMPGEAYTYQITVKNTGAHAADSLEVENELPPGVSLVQAVPEAAAQDSGKLVWRLPALAPRSQANFAAEVLVASDLDTALTFLISRAHISAKNDTTPGNNVAQDTVLVQRAAQVVAPDVTLSQTLLADSLAVQGGDTLHFVHGGSVYRKTIALVNLSPGEARDALLMSIHPAMVQIEQVQPAPARTAGDTLFWHVDRLPPYSRREFQIDALFPATLPPGFYPMAEQAVVRAPDEPDSLWYNNSATDSLFGLIPFVTIPQPLITAEPPIVRVRDSVVVRVQVPVEIREWDIHVYFADGSIDTTYADDFIAHTLPMPGLWYTLTPEFRDTRLLRLNAEQERITFEIRTIDLLGNRASAQTHVLVRSNNALTIDRNTFQPELQSTLAIRFKLSSRRLARLDLYDLSGYHITKITEDIYEGDWNTYDWNGLTTNGQKVGSGVYLVTLRSGDFQSWRKIIVVR